MAATVRAAETSNARAPAGEAELKAWLENMVWHHRFAEKEIQEATGLSDAAIQAALTRFDIRPETKPLRSADGPLLMLPYPGGRHPRIGFLEGAIRPQRETKISVFTPWDDSQYVVVDVPEAIWSNLGLTYLAHTHIDTIWSAQNVSLPTLEWEPLEDGRLRMERTLPNGIRFGSLVRAGRDAVRMEMWLHNGTPDVLSDLRVQNCVMLKGAREFNEQTGDNKVLDDPFAACRSKDGRRWIITAWQPCHRPWINPPVPCLHSDPKFPDCEPGQTRRLKGWLSFYEGESIQAEFQRIKRDAWWTDVR